MARNKSRIIQFILLLRTHRALSKPAQCEMEMKSMKNRRDESEGERAARSSPSRTRRF